LPHDVVDARPIGKIYFGPTHWYVFVDGHFDGGAPVIDNAKIDFTGLNPKKVANEEIQSPVFEYKRP